MQTISLPCSYPITGINRVEVPLPAEIKGNLPQYQPDGTPTEALLKKGYNQSFVEKRPIGGSIYIFLQEGILKECTYSLFHQNECLKLHLTPIGNKETNTTKLQLSFDELYHLQTSEDATKLFSALGYQPEKLSTTLFSALFTANCSLEHLAPNVSIEGYLLAQNGQLWKSLIRCVRVRGNGNECYYDIQLECSVFLLNQHNGSETQELNRLKAENRNLQRVQLLLRRSMTRLKVLAEYSPDVIMQFDRQHRHLFVNQQVESLTPWKVEDYLGKTHEEIGFPPDFCSLCDKALAYVFETGNSHRLELDLPSGHVMDWFLIPEKNDESLVTSVITTARDITEQRLTEHRLRQSEQKIKDAFKVTRLSSWEYEISTDALSMSDEFRNLLGLTPECSINGTEYMNQFVHPKDLDRFKDSIREAKKARSSDFQQVIDYRIKPRTGNTLTILVSLRVELHAGRTIKMYGTCQDITRLKNTEQELEEYRASLELLVETRTLELKRSETRLADALRIANLGTWEFDVTTESFLVSDDVLEILGTTSDIEEGNLLQAEFVRSLIHPDDFEKYRSAVIKAKEATSEKWSEQVEFRIKHVKGDWRALLLSIRVNKNRPGSQFFGTLQDITSIQYVTQEKERLTSIIETTPDIISIAKPDGTITYLNAAGRSFFGIHHDGELARRSFFSFQSHKAKRVVSSKQLKEAEQQGLWSGEHRYLRFDGIEIPVSQLVIAHKNGAGKVEFYSTILRDISAQKKIEEDLLNKNKELDTFLYRASHDLRGPIATLMGLYQVAQYEVKEENALNLFDLYNSQVIRLNNITNTLIELTKLKERDVEPAEVNFKGLVQEAFANLQRLTESQDMLFHYDVEAIQGFISDPHLILVVLQNLIENSIKYKRQEVDSFVKVEVKFLNLENEIQLKVSDNGMGIEPDIQENIFNMFFRGNQRSKGSGLGLYVLKNVVNKLNGKITLYSVPYKGTTFKINLPQIKDAL